MGVGFMIRALTQLEQFRHWPGPLMKTLHIYLMRQILTTLVMTVGVFTGVLLLGSLAKELLVLLIDENVGFWTVAKAIGMLIPFILVFALPIGMLTATLLVFGRLSADQELTAMRASGISLVSLVSPVLMFSVLMSVVCAMINLDFAPRARNAYRQMLYDVGRANIELLLPAGTFITQFPGYTIYIGGYSNEGELKDVSIYTMDEGKVATVFKAKRARLDQDLELNEANLTLFDGQQVSFTDDLTFYFSELPLNQPLSKNRDSGFGETSLANMSLPDLLIQSEKLERAGIETTPVNVQIHSKIAFSFACIGFTLIGIPLGLQSHRRETRIGIFVALILIGVYYGFFIFAEAQESKPHLHPYLFVWIPNFLFQIVGAVLLYRADRNVK